MKFRYVILVLFVIFSSISEIYSQKIYGYRKKGKVEQGLLKKTEMKKYDKVNDENNQYENEELEKEVVLYEQEVHDEEIYDNKLKYVSNEDAPEPQFEKKMLNKTISKPQLIHRKTKDRSLKKISKTNMDEDTIIALVLIGTGIIIFVIGLLMQLVWQIPIWGIVVTVLGSSAIGIGIILLF